MLLEEIIRKSVATKRMIGLDNIDSNNADISGKWANELGSTIEIIQPNKSAFFTGKYTSAVSAGGDSTTGSITGNICGNLIVFLVNWDEYAAITSWVGQIDINSPFIVTTQPTTAKNSFPEKITTLWMMTSRPDDIKDQWASINSGTDTFHRINK
ncbi:avidin/streptavidin family protein [Photorhabdus noenieputensis]|uniref:avidin/streptavidin family protein n=1 Tax=Photorhabdus noenieputensis TaxID=1208607 RepID=UPI001BD61A5A|nr:avidin/streptavidin family protein [Photorhabdus noenieputensis]MCK3671262.1 avidin/streptavidin family protein [Photorhabdus noenieputensis]